MAVNFVKFERGTSIVFERRKNNHSLDENTLYFIYDKTRPEDGGLLYLGYTLIGGTGVNSSISALNDLEDVDLEVVSSLAGGMLLRYSSIHSKWEPVSISQALQDAGIDFSTNGSGAQVSSITLEDELTIAEALAEIASSSNEGDMAVVEGQPYVYDGSQWISLTNSVLEDRVSALEDDVASLLSLLQTINGKINNLNHLSYEVLPVNSTIENIDTSAQDADKKVYLVPVENAELGSNNNYDEYMVVNGNLEKLGSWGVNLNDYVTTSLLNSTISNLVTNTLLNTAISNLVTATLLNNVISDLDNTYVTKTEFNTVVGNLPALASKLGKESLTITEGLDEIYERLIWSEIVDE